MDFSIQPRSTDYKTLPDELKDDEELGVKNKELDVKTLYDKIGNDVTNYNRKSVV